MSKKKENTVVVKDRFERFAQECANSLIKVSKSAIVAGFSEKTVASQGSRLLKNVKFISRMREIQQEMLNQLPVSIHYVIQGYVDIYNRCMQAEPGLKWDYEVKVMRDMGDYIFDSKCAMVTLNSIGKYLSKFIEKVKIDGNIEYLGRLEEILNSINEFN